MKKLICCLLSISILLLLPSCDSDESGISIEGERVVALSSQAEDNTSAVDFCEENGYKYTEYSSFEDCLLALEHGKAEYIVLNEFEYNNLNLTEDDLTLFTKTNNSKSYCAVFSRGNEKLYREFNEAINLLKDNGTLEKVKDGYFRGERIDISPSKEFKGEITVLCCADFNGRVFYNESSELTGLDIFIAEAVLTYLGYTPVFSDCNFEDMFHNLENGKGDVIFSAVEYTEQRDKAYLLTNSYYTDEYCVYMKQ